MRLIRYDRDYSRRHFLTSSGVAAAGVLAPLWKVIAREGNVTAAYPDELLSIEGYTRGKISSGDEITAANVELVKELLDPVKYQQVAALGRRLRVVPTSTDIMRLSPGEYIDATLRNRGQSRFDEHGHVGTPYVKPW